MQHAVRMQQLQMQSQQPHGMAHYRPHPHFEPHVPSPNYHHSHTQPPPPAAVRSGGAAPRLPHAPLQYASAPASPHGYRDLAQPFHSAPLYGAQSPHPHASPPSSQLSFSPPYSASASSSHPWLYSPPPQERFNNAVAFSTADERWTLGASLSSLARQPSPSSSHSVHPRGAPLSKTAVPPLSTRPSSSFSSPPTPQYARQQQKSQPPPTQVRAAAPSDSGGGPRYADYGPSTTFSAAFSSQASAIAHAHQLLQLSPSPSPPAPAPSSVVHPLGPVTHPHRPSPSPFSEPRPVRPRDGVRSVFSPPGASAHGQAPRLNGFGHGDNEQYLRPPMQESRHVHSSSSFPSDPPPFPLSVQRPLPGQHSAQSSAPPSAARPPMPPPPDPPSVPKRKHTKKASVERNGVDHRPVNGDVPRKRRRLKARAEPSPLPLNGLLSAALARPLSASVLSLSPSPPPLAPPSHASVVPLSAPLTASSWTGPVPGKAISHQSKRYSIPLPEAARSRSPAVPSPKLPSTPATPPPVVPLGPADDISSLPSLLPPPPAAPLSLRPPSPPFLLFAIPPAERTRPVARRLPRRPAARHLVRYLKMEAVRDADLLWCPSSPLSASSERSRETPSPSASLSALSSSLLSLYAVACAWPPGSQHRWQELLEAECVR